MLTSATLLFSRRERQFCCRSLTFSLCRRSFRRLRSLGGNDRRRLFSSRTFSDSNLSSVRSGLVAVDDKGSAVVVDFVSGNGASEFTFCNSHKQVMIKFNVLIPELEVGKVPVRNSVPFRGLHGRSSLQAGLGGAEKSDNLNGPGRAQRPTGRAESKIVPSNSCSTAFKFSFEIHTNG